MTKSKKRIITIIFTVLITSSALIGCADKQKTTATEDNSAKYTEQIAHYEALIRELEAELLLNKEENYIISTKYEQQIDSLEESIASLNDKISSIATSSGETHEEPINPTATEPVELAKENKFSYRIKGTRITITGYNGNDGKIEIPSLIDGFPVTSIGESAFKNCGAQEIILPDSVTHIDWFAFSGCSRLEKITIPSSVTKIDYGAFANCAKGLTVICESGSYAQAFAASWGIATREK